MHYMLYAAMPSTYHQNMARTAKGYAKVKTSIVVYYKEDQHAPTQQQAEQLRAHFKLETVTIGNARKQKVEPKGQLFLTDRHATHAASNAGAHYMGWEFACRQAGVK